MGFNLPICAVWLSYTFWYEHGSKQEGEILKHEIKSAKKILCAEEKMSNVFSGNSESQFPIPILFVNSLARKETGVCSPGKSIILI